MEKASLVIKNIKIVNPGNKQGFVGDVVIKGNKIIDVSPETTFVGVNTIDGSGCYISSGWIDIHTHIFSDSTWTGMPADIGLIPCGVTASVDAGSAGVANYKALIKQLNNSYIRGKIMLNVGAAGIAYPAQITENANSDCWNMDLFDEAFTNYSDKIIGLKIRYDKTVANEMEKKPLEDTIKLAERYNTRAIVHVTDAPISMREIARTLRPGDVFCHIGHNNGNDIFEKNGKICNEIIDARNRGVIFDGATGRGNYSFEIMKQLKKERFLPDTISSDVSSPNWFHPQAGSLPVVMNKWLALGLTVDEIISRVTFAPAKQLGISGLGSIENGNLADLTLFRISNKKMTYLDKYGSNLECDKIFEPIATIINGKLLFKAVDCTIE